jgi:hypothetical protein
LAHLATGVSLFCPAAKQKYRPVKISCLWGGVLKGERGTDRGAARYSFRLLKAEFRYLNFGYIKPFACQWWFQSPYKRSLSSYFIETLRAAMVYRVSVSL